MSFSKICLDYLRVMKYITRRALRKYLTEVKHRQLLTDTGHQFHIMLDQKDCHIKVIANETDAIDIYDPNLTLKGIHLVYKKQNRKIK